MRPRRALARRRLSAPAFLLLAGGIALGTGLASIPARAQQTPGGEASAAELRPVPEPVGFVNDRANVLDEGIRARLEGFLDQVRRKTGAEFAVLTVPSTAPETPSEYKVRVFERWGLGKKGEDSGLLMLVAIEEREVRFETGYGLEGTLPDGLQSRIFRQQMAPRFRAGDYAGGITAGVLECARRIAAEKGVTLEWNGRELRYSATSRRAPFWVALIPFLVIVFFIFLLSRIHTPGFPRGYRPRGGWWIGPGGGFGGGGFGGGGFGGGSFGGFGGGASGGGGGGGKW